VGGERRGTQANYQKKEKKVALKRGLKIGGNRRGRGAESVIHQGAKRGDPIKKLDSGLHNQGRNKERERNKNCLGEGKTKKNRKLLERIVPGKGGYESHIKRTSGSTRGKTRSG